MRQTNQKSDAATLTAREWQVLNRRMQGRTPAEIAHELDINRGTAQALVSRAVRKTGAEPPKLPPNAQKNPKHETAETAEPEREELFNPEMELLCSVPPHPNNVALKSLAEEFGYKNSGTVTRQLKLAAARIGAKIDTNYNGNLITVYVPRGHWHIVKRHCQRYWDRTHKQTAEPTA